MDVSQKNQDGLEKGDSRITHATKKRVAESIVVVAAVNQPLLLRGIGSLIAGERDIELVAGVASGDDAISAIEKYKPDIVLLNRYLPGRSALEVIEAVARKGLKTRMVLLTAGLSVDEFQQMMRAGIHGVYLKDMPESTLVRCIRAAHMGEDILENDIVLRAFGSTLRRNSTQPGMSILLTARERSVAQQVARGLSNKEIARRLGLTEGTVKSHLHRVYYKLRVRSRFGLMQLNDRQAGDQAKP